VLEAGSVVPFWRAADDRGDSGMSGADTLATADIVVVGAGITGLCTTWELLQRGFSVAVIEQRFPNYGASGRNPGSLWLQTRRTGLELDLARAGKRKYDEYLDVLGDVFDYRAAGGLFFFETDEQADVITDYVRNRQASGLDISMVSREEAEKLSPILPDTAIGAAFCSDDAQIDSLSFVAAMEAACVRAGARLFRNTAVLSTLRQGDRAVGVRTVRGEVTAAGVVWATGAWAGTLRAEGIALPVETSRVGQLMMQPVETQVSPVLHGPRGVYGCAALHDTATFTPSAFAGFLTGETEDGGAAAYEDTVVLNRGGSLYVGHSIDGRGSLNPHISLEATRAMVAAALARYGRYANFGVTGLWAGLGTETPDRLPIVDRADGVYVNVGHAWGVASGPVSGQVMAEVIAGEESPFAAGLRANRASLHTGPA
jgi:glycine/D-amino acid oxidase-like deaminating enzyme